ncbi:hypothetical protein ULG90_14510 [Halopseudomonas pachastrellae]|jgi:hypothetical protein|uniref:DUF6957 family protein n=1 Tax=Halopseudomonas aestusnigri TaxID=857252 RepID=UPI001E28AA3C|nr:hypothetical protein [Halopseudomonas aestusnigri]MED5493759.1 hypothetical protein [Pseudomonadota bacterium]UGV30976.1 hypothetical protein LO767_00165 [Halopseudomonas aestusnigri]WVM89963.1 hypothetical protein UMZ34_06380 [Halopseudomonas pachastrellae]WVM91338.1 hypothetical protein ULG90_14510 [Halopseudomonas pachastrellae]|tara:strand:- start:654 stop:1052 length:399 start_codon:yes stop_codon:yes gene_type:complete
MKQLNEVADLFFSAGIPMPGVQVSQDEALRLVRERYPYCEYCLVADWRWIDLDVTKAQLAELTRTNRKPAVIYAASVIYDSQRRWDVGDFVRTSYLYKFEEGFIFQTLNTIYILIGDGVRKKASLETLGRIF